MAIDDVKSFVVSYSGRNSLTYELTLSKFKQYITLKTYNL